MLPATKAENRAWHIRRAHKVYERVSVTNKFLLQMATGGESLEMQKQSLQVILAVQADCVP